MAMNNAGPLAAAPAGAARALAPAAPAPDRIEQLGRLPGEVLRLLACFEHGAELATLRALSSKPDGVAKALQQAARAELIQLREQHYHFIHASVRQLVYQRIPAPQRAALHLRIGRQLLAGTPAAALPTMLFSILEQLNPGVAGMPMRAERERCAHLNLQAGERARAHAALDTALAYFGAGLALLEQDRWQRSYGLAFALQRQHTACLLLLGRHQLADAGVAELARWASGADRAAVVRLKTALHLAQGHPERAFAAALAQVAHAGLHLARPACARQDAGSMAALWQAIGAAGPAALGRRARIADPELRQRLDAMAEVLQLALYGDAAAVPAMLARIVNATLEHGNSCAAPLAYVALAAQAGQRHGQAGAALELGRLALALAAREGLHGYAAATQLAAGQLLLPWQRPFDESRAALAGALEAALLHGDAPVAAQARHALLALAMLRGEPLASVHGELEAAWLLVSAGRCPVRQLLASRLGLIRTLRGHSAAFGLLDHPALDEAAAEQGWAGAGGAAARGYWLHKLQARYYAGQHGAALQAASVLEALPAPFAPALDAAECALFCGLAHAAAHDAGDGDDNVDNVNHTHDMDNVDNVVDANNMVDANDMSAADQAEKVGTADHRAAAASHAAAAGVAGSGAAPPAGRRQRPAPHLQALDDQQDTLARLTQHNPSHFAAMNHLLAAESARLRRQTAAAMRAYELAIRAAAAQRQPQFEALAHELAARHYASLGLDTAATAHGQQAHQAYLRWGAYGKARQLACQQPALAAAAPPRAPEPAHAAGVGAMGQFAASIAHEVNQPLAAMVLNAGAGLNWLNHQPPNLELVRSSLQTIIAAGTRAADIIRGMRRLAHRATPELAPVLVDEAIAEVLALLRAELQQRDIGVFTHLALGQHVIRADRAQLQQVMMNLLFNAIDAMAPVSGRARLLIVRSGLSDAAGALRVSVEDNGVGLAPEQAQRIFDALVSNKPDGMGMGLAICRAIVETHGGRIWFTARQPHGAAFHVSLPAPPADGPSDQ